MQSENLPGGAAVRVRVFRRSPGCPMARQHPSTLTRLKHYTIHRLHSVTSIGVRPANVFQGIQIGAVGDR
jgi:hypothetical protein